MKAEKNQMDSKPSVLMQDSGSIDIPCLQPIAELCIHIREPSPYDQSVTPITLQSR